MMGFAGKRRQVRTWLNALPRALDYASSATNLMSEEGLPVLSQASCPSEHRVQQHRVQQHSGSTPPQRHTLAVVVPVGSQQKARAAIGMVACFATSLMSQPTCDCRTVAADADGAMEVLEMLQAYLTRDKCLPVLT